MLSRFAVDSSQNVMTPKNGYDGQVGNTLLSDKDKTKLQRSYNCKESAPFEYNNCGGYRYRNGILVPVYRGDLY